MPVAKRRMNLPVNRDAGVHSWYLAVSGEFPFFDLFLGADCIGVLARGSFFEIQVFHSFRTDLGTFLNLVSSRLYRCFAESPFFSPSPPVILGTYPGAQDKGSPCVLRRFWGVRRFLIFFTGFC